MAIFQNKPTMRRLSRNTQPKLYRKKILRSDFSHPENKTFSLSRGKAVLVGLAEAKKRSKGSERSGAAAPYSRKVLLCQRSHAYIRLARRLLAELDGAVDQCEKRVVLAYAYILTGVVYRASLTNDDVTRLSELTTEKLYTESLALRLTAVLRTTYTFLCAMFLYVFKGYATISSTRTCDRY